MVASFATSTASLTHAENARSCSAVVRITKLPTGPTTKLSALPMGADAAVLLKLGHAELGVGTSLAVESGLGHILEITKNAKSSMLGVADFAPASFLRLGRDQEAYDFMKWWITTPDTIMRPPTQPYTAVKNQDILEPAAVFMGKCPSMAFMATLTPLKL
jgi:hypothetical protein